MLKIEIMPFGKYKGERIENIPTDYLEWALGEWNWEDRRILYEEFANQLALRRGEGVKRE
jgi:hypothetical protein